MRHKHVDHISRKVLLSHALVHAFKCTEKGRCRNHIEFSILKSYFQKKKKKKKELLSKKKKKKKKKKKNGQVCSRLNIFTVKK